MASTHTLAVNGLADQGELLAFASALEAEPQISAIALVRADGTLGIFSVIAGSRGDLVRACRRARGFEVELHGEDLHWDVLEVMARRAEPGRRRLVPHIPRTPWPRRSRSRALGGASAVGRRSPRRPRRQRGRPRRAMSRANRRPAPGSRRWTRRSTRCSRRIPRPLPMRAPGPRRSRST